MEAGMACGLYIVSVKKICIHHFNMKTNTCMIPRQMLTLLLSEFIDAERIFFV
jgi:hypothetical protein